MNSAWSPIAAPRDSDGKSTTPSGTPMTPIGIWRSVKAMVNAVTAPSPRFVASAVTTTNVIWLAPRPMARGAIRASALRAAGSPDSMRGV